MYDAQTIVDGFDGFYPMIELYFLVLPQCIRYIIIQIRYPFRRFSIE